jgi:glycosyltransferase involved in cell wall biosynthesis
MRVVMFGEQVFCRNWISAARLVSDVIHVRQVGRRAGGPGPDSESVPGIPGLFRDPRDDCSYAVTLPTDLPYRLLGRAADVPNVRALAGVLSHLAERHGELDLLHGHFFSGSRMFPALHKRLGLPYVVTEHSTALTLQSPDKAITARGLGIARRVYQDAAVVMPVSESLLASIRSLGLTGLFTVVPNPIDASRFRLAQPYAGGRLELVCVSRLAKVKALDVLIRALASVVGHVVHVRLTIVGEGPEEANLRELAESLGVAHCVEFAGGRPNDDIPAFLSRAHIFVMSSLVENLSIAVIEALATGLPVVATRVGGQPELVQSGNGVLVPVGDSDALASAVVAIARGELVFDGEAIASRARERFGQEVVAQRLAEIYRSSTANQRRNDRNGSR